MKKQTIYALGYFDGVHLGHQALLKECRRLAEENSCRAGVVTFATHPDTLVIGKTPLLINTRQDREEMLLGCWVDHILELPFDENLRNQSWQDFLEDLVKQGAAGFVCGSDFRFGAGGRGTAEKLAAFCEEKGLVYAVVPQQLIGGIRVSSALIRRLIEDGEMERAVEFLGHPHVLTGKVVSGQQLGRTIGIPTANVKISSGLVLPKAGVYACRVDTPEGEFLAVTNVGTRPTVAGKSVTVEAHLLDFDGDLYDKTLRVEFWKFLREEKKFPGLEELQEEILKNVRQTRNFFEKSEK
ncbi:MAG: bifunctional riboflavin kinase/FAD synthetase [Oscillospiraceae bacterium]|nr:bifunctional riboflavin kinase/FAD synthetase [Oscillospiraceae bacterium]